MTRHKRSQPRPVAVQHSPKAEQEKRAQLAATVVAKRDAFATALEAIDDHELKKRILATAGEYIAAMLLKDRFERPTKASAYRDALRALNRPQS